MFNIKSFENLFRYNRQLEVDLRKFSLKDIVNFPYESEAGLSEYYIQERLNDNELIVNYHRDRAHIGGIHHISYLPAKSLITIESSPVKRELYRFLFLLVMLLIFLVVGKSTWTLGGGLFVVVIGIFWIWGIRDESAELNRELVIRINYTRRTGRKVNVRD